MEDFICIGTIVLEQFAILVEDDNGNVTPAENRKLHGFLEYPILPFQEGDLAVAFVLDPLNTDLLLSH